jgi:CheY-like chemotaxis protein
MRKLNLLVVDDELKHNKHLFDLFLTEKDFVLDYTDSKNDFLNKNIKMYDAVILDINLDLMDITFFEALEKIGGNAPIVLVSTKLAKETTVIRLKEALHHNKNVSVVQTFDLGLLQDETSVGLKGIVDDKKNVAEVYNSIIKINVKKKKLKTIGPDEDLFLLHISDPQYGDPNTDAWSAFLENDIQDFLKDYFKKIDFVAITGDVAFSGRKKDYALAKLGVKKLLQSVTRLDSDSSLERLILVPGNHDVDFRFSSVAELNLDITKEKVRITHKPSDENTETSEYSMIPFRRFAYDLTGNIHWITSKDLNWVNNNFTYLGLRFLLLNSAGNISCNYPSLPRLAPNVTERLSETTFLDPGKYFTIAFSHHGPIDPDYPKEIEALNDDWPSLSNFLRQSKVRLWLHGHGHRRLTLPFPFGLVSEQELSTLKDVVNKNESNPIFLERNQFIRVMAPTSHLGEKLRHGDNKGFNVIKLERKNNQIKFVEVNHFEVTENGPFESERAKVRFKI